MEKAINTEVNTAQPTFGLRDGHTITSMEFPQIGDYNTSGNTRFDSLAGNENIAQTTLAGEKLPQVMGMDIPVEVLRQLRMQLDMPIGRMTQGQLHEAVNSYHEDGVVVNDPNGTGTLDKFRRDWDEPTTTSFYGHNPREIEVMGEHTARLKAEREQAYSHAQHLHNCMNSCA